MTEPWDSQMQALGVGTTSPGFTPFRVKNWSTPFTTISETWVSTRWTSSISGSVA